MRITAGRKIHRQYFMAVVLGSLLAAPGPAMSQDVSTRQGEAGQDAQTSPSSDEVTRCLEKYTPALRSSKFIITICRGTFSITPFSGIAEVPHPDKPDKPREFWG